jgi:calcineurin-like phosphoesterase family protein
MIKVLKFKQTEEQKHYFVSDLHWNHNPKWNVPLWKARGYDSVTAHNEDIIAKINEMVRPNDILHHLGDLTLNCTEKEFEAFIARINCQNIHLLWGNHNNPSQKIYEREVSNFWFNTIIDENLSHAVFVDKPEIYPFRYKNVVFMGNSQEIVVDGQYIVMYHYPTYVFNYIKDGAWHLCGHSHYSLPLSQANNNTSKILDVGWDGLKRPYTMDDIAKIMQKKNILKADHH